MRIEAPKIEVSNLEGAIQGSKIIQIIWFNLMWCILLGPQLSPVSSVLLLDIIFIDWIKVKSPDYSQMPLRNVLPYNDNEIGLYYLDNIRK